MKRVGVAILGVGVVGGGTFKTLVDHREFYKHRLQVVYINVLGKVGLISEIVVYPGALEYGKVFHASLVILECDTVKISVALPGATVVVTKVYSSFRCICMYGDVFELDRTLADEVDMLESRVLYSSVVGAAVRIKRAYEHVVKIEVLTVVRTHHSVEENASVRLEEVRLRAVLPGNVV